MQVKSGYKQTEVGVIPEEWDARQIRDVCTLINGRGFKPYEWKTVGLPIVRIQNLNGSEDFNFYSGQYNPKILVEHGQLLFAWSGSRGTSFGPHVWNGGRALLNYHTWKVLVNESRATLEFLLHALRQLTSFIEDRAHGASALVHTQKWEMEKFLIPIPARLPEQRAIASALNDVNGLLGGLDRLIAKKRDLKQAAMQQLLTGQTRLPAFDGEWKVKAIGDEIDLLTGFPFPSSQYVESGVRLLRGSNVKRGETDWTEDLVQCWPKLSPDIAVYALEVGDLVIAMDGSLVGRSYARLSLSDLPALLLQRVARIRSKTIDTGFLSHFIGSDRFVKYCDSVKTVTAIPHISSADIRKFSIPLPPSKAEQTAIAEVLSDMGEELAALGQRREKTRALKLAMMQELLTGKTRLV